MAAAQAVSGGGRDGGRSGGPEAALIRLCDLAGRPRGTGFLADADGTMVTSHEAVDGLARLVLHAPGGQVCLVEASAVIPLPEQGLALVATEGLDLPVLPVAPGGPAHPEGRVRLPGRARPLTATVTGTCAATYAATDRFHLLGEVYELALDRAESDPAGASRAGAYGAEANGAGAHGADTRGSGAPVLDAATGAVLGVVVTALYAGHRAGGFAVPLRSRGAPAPLAELLARNAATVPAYGPHLNLAGALRLTGTAPGSAAGGPPWREPVARPHVTDALADFLSRGGEGAPLVLGLVGEPGTGRSTELAALAARRADTDCPAPTLRLRGAELRPGDGGIKDAVERALCSAARTLGAAGGACGGRPGDPLAGPVLVEDLVDAVARLGRSAGRPLLVLLDAPEEMPPVLAHALPEWAAETSRWLRASRTRLVVAARPEFWEQAGAALPADLLYEGSGAAGGRPLPPCVRLGDLRPEEAATARACHGLPEGALAAADAAHPLALRLLSEVRSALGREDREEAGDREESGDPGEAGDPPRREEVFAAHLDLVCLRLALRVGAGSEPPVRGTAVRRLAARAAGRVHEAARRCLGPGQGELDREAFEEIFPWRTGWASAVLGEGLFVPAGAGYRFAHEEVGDWLQSLHLDLPSALDALVHRWCVPNAHPPARPPSRLAPPGAGGEFGEAPVRLPARSGKRAGQPPPVPPAPPVAPTGYPRSLPVPRHRAGPVVQALLHAPPDERVGHLMALVEALDEGPAGRPFEPGRPSCSASGGPAGGAVEPVRPQYAPPADPGGRPAEPAWPPCGPPADPAGRPVEPGRPSCSASVGPGEPGRPPCGPFTGSIGRPVEPDRPHSGPPAGPSGRPVEPGRPTFSPPAHDAKSPPRATAYSATAPPCSSPPVEADLDADTVPNPRTRRAARPEAAGVVGARAGHGAEQYGTAARREEAGWWAAHLLRETLLGVADAAPYRDVLRALAGRIVVRSVAVGGFARERLGGLGEFGPWFWRRVPVGGAERLDLLRLLLPADGPPPGPGERFLGAVAEILRADPAGALPVVCGWFADDRPLQAAPDGPRLTVASAAQALLHTHRRLAVDDLAETLVAAAHPAADAVLTALAEDEPSAVCRAVDRWAHDPRPERHVAAATYGTRTAPFVRSRADRELLRYAALTILGRAGEPTLHGAALGLLVRDPETRARYLPTALEAFAADEAGPPPSAMIAALPTDAEAVLAAFRIRLRRTADAAGASDRSVPSETSGAPAATATSASSVSSASSGTSAVPAASAAFAVQGASTGFAMPASSATSASSGASTASVFPAASGASAWSAASASSATKGASAVPAASTVSAASAASDVLAELAAVADPATARRVGALVEDHLRACPQAAPAVARYLDLRLEQGLAARPVLLPLTEALLRDHPPSVRCVLAPVLAAPGSPPSRPLRQELLDTVLDAERDLDVLDALLAAAASGAATRHPLLTRDLVHRLALLLGRTPHGAARFDRRTVALATAHPAFARLLRCWLTDTHPWDVLLGPSAHRSLAAVPRPTPPHRPASSPPAAALHP